MTQYKLYYFNSRGRAETVRVMFAYKDVKYEDFRFEEITDEIRKELPLGQVPVLEVNGKKICQSRAIDAYVAKELGLHGKDNMAALKIDECLGCLEDVAKPVVMIFAAPKDKQDDLKKDYREVKVPELLKKFQDYLTKNPLDKQINLAHISIFTGFQFLRDYCGQFDLPKNVQEICDKVAADPKIAAWIKKRPATKM